MDHGIASHLLKACDDGSSLVRCELIVALQYVVRAFEPNFVNVCRAAAEEEEINKQGWPQAFKYKKDEQYKRFCFLGLSLSKTLSQGNWEIFWKLNLSEVEARKLKYFFSILLILASSKTKPSRGLSSIHASSSSSCLDSLASNMPITSNR